MIDVDLARSLRDAGLRWKPATGDRFVVDKPGLEDDVYTLSEMTVEQHVHPTGTTIGFNGTTEWALDSVDATEALWLPREDQLRVLLGPAFRTMSRSDDPDRPLTWAVVARVGNETRTFADPDTAIAYGEALLAYIRASLVI